MLLVTLQMGQYFNHYYCYSISTGNKKLLQHWLLLRNTHLYCTISSNKHHPDAANNRRYFTTMNCCELRLLYIILICLVLCTGISLEESAPLFIIHLFNTLYVEDRSVGLPFVRLQSNSEVVIYNWGRQLSTCWECVFMWLAISSNKLKGLYGNH